MGKKISPFLIVQEDIRDTVVISENQIICVRPIRHVTPIRRYRSAPGMVISLYAIERQRDQFCDVELAVVKEGVYEVIGISTHQVAGARREHHVTPICGYG